MKRLFLLLFLSFFFLLTLLSSFAETMTLSEKSRQIVLADLPTSYPGWTVCETDVYGTGLYGNTSAMHVDVLLCKIGDGQLHLKSLSVLANPLWEGNAPEYKETDTAPLPLSVEAEARISAMEPRDITVDGFRWLSSKATPGCADFMLNDGEVWEDLGVFAEGLVGVARNEEGRQGIRVAPWDGEAYGEIIASPMWETGFFLNTIHSGYGSLELHVGNYLTYIDCDADGNWVLAGVNNGYAIYGFGDHVLYDWSDFDCGTTNNYYHYGCVTFPLALEDADLDSLVFRGPELLKLLDTSGWACVRVDETPLYGKPGGDIIGWGYARMAGTIVTEDSDWVLLQIGSETCGLQVWCKRNDLAFGAETEKIRCGFPCYEVDRSDGNIAAVLNQSLIGLDTPFPEDWHERDYPEKVWIIAHLSNGNYLLQIDEDLVRPIPADVFTEILEPEEYWPSYDFELTDEEWEALWSDDDWGDEDWGEDDWDEDDWDEE
ncbi:MAG: hypothetical protein IK127_05030 [Clostridia bacterium]|nr:hypothetical protein [Clostridia bacterium]